MRFRRLLPLAALLGLAGPYSAHASEILQAEDGSLPGGAEIQAEADALGGSYVAQPNDYRPLFTASVPAGGESFTIWARGRGHGICLKSKSADGKQRELKWLFNWPVDQWTWRSFGTFRRDELGEAIVLIRQPNGEPGAGLDAVVISADPDYLPPGATALSAGQKTAKPKPQREAGAATEETAALPGELAAPVEDTPIAAAATIHWDKVTNPIPRGTFSVAIFAGFDPEVAAAPAYQEGLAYLDVPIVRYHNTNMIDDSTEKAVGWVDVEETRWDSEKIAAALSAWNPKGVKKVITIPDWPEWMDRDGDRFLDADQFEAFAAFCADLVRITNVDNDFAISYFEITNERDGLYWVDLGKKNQPDRLDELTRIYNLCAKAMKAIDPSIQTGGPAAMRPDYVEELRRFATATLPNLDFLSAHGYASGKTSEPDASIYNKTQKIGDHISELQAMLAEVSPDRPVPIHLNEYAISWTWETREPRMLNHKGAVFDALCFVEFATHQLDVSNAWNERDGVYGKMDKDFAFRPSAHVFHYANGWMMGDAVQVETTDPTKVVVFAAKKESQAGLLVINRTNAANTLELEGATTDATWNKAVVDEAGLTESSDVSLAGKIELPPHSVTFFHGAVPPVPASAQATEPPAPE
jgi:hypothetical protein